jgi:hypothetical protein
MPDQPMSVPFEPYAKTLSEQRNQALDQVAQLTAVLYERDAEIAHLQEENAKLRADTAPAVS